MKRPDLLILVAIWEFLTAAGSIIGIVAIALFAFPYTWDAGGVFGLTIAEITLGCYLGLALAGGIGILIGKEWARILTIVHSILSLFFFPFGTVIGILIIIYLTKPEIREYFTGEAPS